MNGKFRFSTDHQFYFVVLVPWLLEFGKGSLTSNIKCVGAALQRKIDSIRANSEAMVQINDAATSKAR